MEINYNTWKNDKSFYDKLIEDASVNNDPVAPIDHSTEPVPLDVVDIVDLLDKYYPDAALFIKGKISERYAEIDLWRDCQTMITNYNYNNYNRTKDNINHIEK